MFGKNNMTIERDLIKRATYLIEITVEYVLLDSPSVAIENIIDNFLI